MYGSPPIKSLEKHKWNIRIVRAKINSEKIELEVIMAFDFKRIQRARKYNLLVV